MPVSGRVDSAFRVWPIKLYGSIDRLIDISIDHDRYIPCYPSIYPSARPPTRMYPIPVPPRLQLPVQSCQCLDPVWHFSMIESTSHHSFCHFTLFTDEVMSLVNWYYLEYIFIAVDEDGVDGHIGQMLSGSHARSLKWERFRLSIELFFSLLTLSSVSKYLNQKPPS